MSPIRCCLVLPIVFAVAAASAPRLSAQDDCCGAVASLSFQMANTAQTSELFAAAPAPCADRSEASHTLELSGRSEFASADVYASIVSQFADERDGLYAWSLSISVGGDIEIVDATTRGTVGGDTVDGPPGLRSSGFEKTAIVNPERNNQGPGVVSAVVLSFVRSIQLQASGTATVLCMTLEPTLPLGGAPVEGRLLARDGLQGPGQPVLNIGATVLGGSSEPLCFPPPLTLRFIEGPAAARFLRCDPNNDARSDLGDAVWIINELFRSGPPTLCAPAADCNGDTRRDLGDVLYSVVFFFRRGPPPPPPFPTCGEGATEDDPRGCSPAAAACDGA
jgi:hypothetical protein